MARPIERADDELLDAADAVLMREGPAAFTLAKAAEAAGVSAATYIKRFGSKEQMHVRLSQRWVASLDERLRDRARPVESPLARLRAVALHSYHDLDHPLTAHNQVATLAVDLQSDELRGWLHLGWEHVRRHLAEHASAAAARGELIGAPPASQLARIVAAAMEGGCIAWCVHPQGSLIERLDGDLTALLSGWTVAATNAGVAG